MKAFEITPRTEPANGYQRKLRDPRWQRRRLDVLNAANWRCEDAGCRRDNQPLEVHHCYYVWGTEPWDYPRDCLIALCEICHEKRQQIERTIKLELLKCLRDVPISRLEKVAWRLTAEALKESEASQ